MMHLLGWFVFAIFKIILNDFEVSGVNGQDYKTEYYNQKIDHFNFLSNGDKTFSQRYIYNDTWWTPGKGPIFFYAGNEGSIEGFWKASGFIHEIAPNFNALVLFGEHRYYGTSLPFGEKSFYNNNIGYLSIEQALVDFAHLLNHAKERFKAQNCTIIAFGGSYGGMLAAYMRFKFPNLIHGAIAASAPIYQISGEQPSTFYQAITKVYDNYNQCKSAVQSAFSQLDKYAKMGKAGFQTISRSFRLCNDITSLQDYQQLLLAARNAFAEVSMGNYPYPADFMGQLPAFPVKVMCQRLTSNPPMVGLYSAISLFYNSTGDSKCFDQYKNYIYCADPTGCGLGDDSLAWDYQACTEMDLEGGTNGVTDMFPVLPFNSTMRDDYCLKKWKVLPRRDSLKTIMWGRDISSASNIVFSNGDLDPWSGGGVLKNVSDSLVAVIVKGGAHHLDLRGRNANDPPSVLAARAFEIRNIEKWLNSK